MRRKATFKHIRSGEVGWRTFLLTPVITTISKCLLSSTVNSCCICSISWFTSSLLVVVVDSSVSSTVSNFISGNGVTASGTIGCPRQSWYRYCFRYYQSLLWNIQSIPQPASVLICSLQNTVRCCRCNALLSSVWLSTAMCSTAYGVMPRSFSLLWSDSAWSFCDAVSINPFTWYQILDSLTLSALSIDPSLYFTTNDATLHLWRYDSVSSCWWYFFSW